MHPRDLVLNEMRSVSVKTLDHIWRELEHVCLPSSDVGLRSSVLSIILLGSFLFLFNVRTFLLRLGWSLRVFIRPYSSSLLQVFCDTMGIFPHGLTDMARKLRLPMKGRLHSGIGEFTSDCAANGGALLSFLIQFLCISGCGQTVADSSLPTTGQRHHWVLFSWLAVTPFLELTEVKKQ